jgi:hypothetical protein
MMVKLVPMQRYRVELPGWKDSEVLTYTDRFEGDYACDVCGREGGTRKGWSERHFFAKGDPDNPKYQVVIGTECIKKCRIVPEAAEHTDTMGAVFKRIGEAE